MKHAKLGWSLAAVTGALAGAGLLAWRSGKASEPELSGRTWQRLRSRHVEPNAADIHVGGEA